jgi:hypothetical protein
MGVNPIVLLSAMLSMTRPDRFCSKFLGKHCICGSIELDLLKITKTCQVLSSLEG